MLDVSLGVGHDRTGPVKAGTAVGVLEPVFQTYLTLKGSLHKNNEMGFAS